MVPLGNVDGSDPSGLGTEYLDVLSLLVLGFFQDVFGHLGSLATASISRDDQDSTVCQLPQDHVLV